MMYREVQPSVWQVGAGEEAAGKLSAHTDKGAAAGLVGGSNSAAVEVRSEPDQVDSAAIQKGGRGGAGMKGESGTAGSKPPSGGSLAEQLSLLLSCIREGQGPLQVGGVSGQGPPSLLVRHWGCVALPCLIGVLCAASSLRPSSLSCSPTLLLVVHNRRSLGSRMRELSRS
jgi:hypothetical protein